jgi:uncharacterized membrane protein YeaQ/YmgE (transglycosylase-associated protein family)
MAAFAALLLIALLIAGFSLFGLTFSIAWYLLAGLIVGGLARLVLPGRENIGWLGTSLVGMAGSVGGGMIGNAFHAGAGIQLVLAVAVSAMLLSVLGYRR